MISKDSDKLFIIGGVTIDTVFLPGESTPLVLPGGAGLFTAAGAHAAGGDVTLFAQRPAPMPRLLADAVQRLDWQGPQIPVNELPRLEIVHFGGGKAELRSADWGAQLRLDPVDLPPDLSGYGFVHIAALGPTQKQLDFAAACRARGARRLSASTYGRAAYGETEAVRALAAACDAFFMNENEAVGAFGGLDGVQPRPDQVIFVTQGATGAVAFESDTRVHHPAPKVVEHNPTGAGDTFCGAALTVLARRGGVREALETGVRLASEKVQR